MDWEITFSGGKGVGKGVVAHHEGFDTVTDQPVADGQRRHRPTCSWHHCGTLRCSEDLWFLLPVYA